MTTIAIQKVRDLQTLPQPLLTELQSLSEKVRTRAYERYLERGGEAGHDMEDWLEAERELTPQTELTEKEREFQARIQTPGVEPRDIEVFAMPGAIVLRSPKFLQRLELPRPVDVDRVAVRFDRGALQIIVPKRQQDAVAAA
jgi:HSP20 family molecular chaperone IbpA